MKIKISNYGNWFVSYSVDGKVVIWDGVELSPFKKLNLGLKKGKLLSISFNKNETKIFIIREYEIAIFKLKV